MHAKKDMFKKAICPLGICLRKIAYIGRKMDRSMGNRSSWKDIKIYIL